MNKFKVGDKLVGVELEDKYGTLALHCWLVPNKVYTVSDVKRSLVFIRTALNEPLGWWAEEWFKLADEQILSNAFDKAVEEVGETFVAKSLIEKEIEMTAEQIREEILRMDSCIEEAKKDIENAEKERNSLVEKLHEKGFTLLDSEQRTSMFVRPTVGDRVRVIRVDKDYCSSIYEGYQFVIQEDDESTLPYMDELNNWFREGSVVKI